jgi:hypothetical protein
VEKIVGVFLYTQMGGLAFYCFCFLGVLFFLRPEGEFFCFLLFNVEVELG